MSSSQPYPRSRPLGHSRIDAGAAPVKPRDAAALIVWRKGARGVEALMGRRSRHASFVPDFFVFPGGRLDPHDFKVRAGSPLEASAVARMAVRGEARTAEALGVAAVRETFEETGLLLAAPGDVGAQSPDWEAWRRLGLAPGLARLCYFGRAITSPVSPIRFHARFFVAHADLLQGDLGGSGELSDLDFYPASRVLAQMPILDVTEFMLNRLLAYADDPNVEARSPVFSYRGETAFIRYQQAGSAGRHRRDGNEA